MDKSAKSDNPPEKRSQSDLADSAKWNAAAFAGRLIVALDGRTMKWLSDQTGISTSMLSDYRNGKMPGADKAVKIADALGVNLLWLLTGRGHFAAPATHAGAEIGYVQTEVRGAGAVGAREVALLFHASGDRPLPLYGSAVGGDYGDARKHIELTELHLTEVLDYLTRPASLFNDLDAYALTIVGDSMEPRFRAGEQVAVAPRSKISIGDDVIVQLRSEEGDDDRVRMVLVKELAKRAPDHIVLKQHNPPRTFSVPMKQIVAMHRVRGHYI